MKAGSEPHALVTATPATERSPNVRDSALSRPIVIRSATVLMGRLACIVMKVSIQEVYENNTSRYTTRVHDTAKSSALANFP